jgi:hypothetical protein
VLGGARPTATVTATLGKFVDARHYDHLLAGEALDVLKPDGSLLLALRPGAVPWAAQELAWPVTAAAAHYTDRRATAAGGAAGLYSGTVGYLIGRPTSCTRGLGERWAALLPLFRAMNRGFKDAAPAEYAFLAEKARSVPSAVFPSTVFTTAAINRWTPTHNAHMAVHGDLGNLAGALGALTVLKGGDYSGAFLVFVRYRVAVDLRPGDLLVADNREAHGLTPIEGEDYERVSVVAFYHKSNRHP